MILGLKRAALGLWVAVGLLAGFGPGVSAQSLAPTVRQIEVEGTRRVDPASIRTRIYTQIGQSVDAQRLSDDIKRVFRLGYFKDVQALRRDHPSGGITLVFQVAERPTVLDIRYDLDGTAVAQEELQKVVDLQKYAILDEAAIQSNLVKISDLYVEEGHFLVQTSYSLEATEDELRLVFSTQVFNAPDPGVERLLEERVRLGSHPAFRGTSVAVSRSIAGMLDHPVRDRLDALSLPVFVAFGAQDRMIPNPYFTGGRTAAVFADALSLLDAQGVLIPNAGHTVHHDAPQAFNDAVGAWLGAL